jgi:hypothetical protein
MQKVNITWDMAARVWWSYLWRLIVYGFVVALLFGGTVILLGDSYEMSSWNVLLGVIYMFSVWFYLPTYITRKILNKKYKDFSVMVVKE